MLVFKNMGMRATIYTINNNDNLLDVIKKCNTNFKNLAHDTTISEIKKEETTINVHNDLSGRDSSDCHPIAAINNLLPSLDSKADKSSLPENYKRLLFDVIYPVDICIDIDNTKDPHSIFGYGVWKDITPQSYPVKKKWKRIE